MTHAFLVVVALFYMPTLTRGLGRSLKQSLDTLVSQTDSRILA